MYVVKVSEYEVPYTHISEALCKWCLTRYPVRGMALNTNDSHRVSFRILENVNKKKIDGLIFASALLSKVHPKTSCRGARPHKNIFVSLTYGVITFP